jgi:hypothetical protein
VKFLVYWMQSAEDRKTEIECPESRAEVLAVLRARGSRTVINHTLRNRKRIGVYESSYWWEGICKAEDGGKIPAREAPLRGDFCYCPI